ncbi:MAG: hypothetical protein ABH952_09355 [Candidatus Omnitrophota bacterium]
MNKLKPQTLCLCNVIIIIFINAFLCLELSWSAGGNLKGLNSCLAPKLVLNETGLQQSFYPGRDLPAAQPPVTPLFFPNAPLKNDGRAANIEDIFILPSESADPAFDQRLKQLNGIRSALSEIGDKETADNAIIEAVLNDPDLLEKISLLIRTQDREGDTGGYAIDRRWAEDLKEEVLKSGIEIIKGRDIAIFQMEYELSWELLEHFREHLVKMKDCLPQDAIYNTGEVAKILMAGGLGSFKPDLVKGWYEVLAKYWGHLEARNRLLSFGVLYAKAIKGQGAIQSRGLEKFATEEEIDPVLTILRKEALKEVATYKIEVFWNDPGGKRTVEVTLYSNPYSDLQAYWIYCPGVFHEAYPGESNDDFRAIQSLLYRKVVLRFIKEEIEKGNMSKGLIFSTSEVNTTLVIPEVIKDGYENDPVFSDLLVHHYNHTVVPAGIPRYNPYMFDYLQIAEKFRDLAIRGSMVDLVEITGWVSDIITGCSSQHTKVLREDTFRKYADKVVEDPLFGNSEGSDIERWQAKILQQVIQDYMRELEAIDYVDLFMKLDRDERLKHQFITDFLAIGEKLKEDFIDALIAGVFGEVFQTDDLVRLVEVDESIRGQLLQRIGGDDVDIGTRIREDNNVKEALLQIIKGILMERPFFTNVRRMVKYKCAYLQLDLYEDPEFKKRIIDAKGVTFIGGRKFDFYYDAQYRRVREIIRQDPLMLLHLIFIPNHNVYTSPEMQQGTNYAEMFSEEYREGGPTSITNAGQNTHPTIGTPDGVLVERLKPITRDVNGKVVSGNGYIVTYGEETADSGARLPDRRSLVENFEAACRDYRDPDNYGIVSYNALRMALTQGNEENQAKGLIMCWARALEEKYLRDTTAAVPDRVLAPHSPIENILPIQAAI